MTQQKLKAQFITIEGGEGVGKSTNIQLIQSILSDNQIDYRLTREPGGTPFAEEIRALLLAKRQEKVDPVAELLLMFAARAQHVNQKILPLLEQGVWVISDRFTDASFAYQGGGRNVDWQKIIELEQWTLKGFKPDLTFLLDVDPEIGMERAGLRGELDRFETEQMAFFERVRGGYARRLQEEPDRFCVIDASKNLSQVQLDIQTHLQGFIHRQQSKNAGIWK